MKQDLWKICLLIAFFAVVGCLQEAVAQSTLPQADSGFFTTVTTPFSSKLSSIGQKIDVLTNVAVMTPEGVALPMSTRLTGKLVKIFPDRRREPAEVLLHFYQATKPDGSTYPINAEIDTPDGRLGPHSVTVTRWTQTPSYAYLKYLIHKKLSTDMTVWNAVMGVNQSSFVDFDDDDFIIRYHKNDVLIGVGDEIKLHFLDINHP